MECLANYDDCSILDDVVSILLSTISKIRHKKITLLSLSIQEAVSEHKQIPLMDYSFSSTDKMLNVDFHKQMECSEISDAKIPTTSFPVVQNLANLPTPINWYPGDKKHASGHYMKICDNLIVKIPLPNLIEHGSKETIPCYRKLRSLCSPTCQFVHIGEPIKKMAFPGRCFCPTFGQKHRLFEDIFKTSFEDLKNMMIYASSELLLLHVWATQKYKTKRHDQPTIINRLDIL